MLRYKIVKMDSKISKTEVEDFKNFDALLRAHKKTIIKRRWLLGILSMTIIMSSGIFLYFSYTNHSAIISSEIAIDESVQLIKADIDPVDKTTTDSIVVKLNKAKKTNNEVSKVVTVKETVKEVEQQFSFIKAFPKYGLDSLVTYLNYELNKMAFDQAEGHLLIAFTIDNSGKPNSIKIIQGLTNEIDLAIIELIRYMPTWEPAIMNGKPVSSTTTLPIKIDIKSINKDK